MNMTKQGKKDFATDDQRRQAVQNRDPMADNAFVYGVATTGIYCRPTCPSRRPNPKNIRFFNTGKDAESAGFRPCKKCRPGDSDKIADIDHRVVRACRIIENADQPPTLDQLAKTVGLSPFYFQKLFKSALGVTPKEYAAGQRIDRMKKGLNKGSAVTDAIYNAGFGSNSRLYENIDRELGMTPSAYQNKGKGRTIQYAVGQSFLGPVLVAATDKGICAIEFGPSSEDLIDQLHETFSKADLQPAGNDFNNWVQTVVAYIESPPQVLDLPLDIQGTAFQRQVWKALQNISPGTTATYSDVAEQIGKPKAVRAVANACAANKIAVAVPCHRVVRQDGNLGGYKWGLDRKQELLKREAIKAPKKPRYKN
jgi:AraC family transcriptional regulator of adaptative response/methylated-DNA-[protein]-cysteine methyltransferase